MGGENDCPRRDETSDRIRHVRVDEPSPIPPKVLYAEDSWQREVRAEARVLIPNEFLVLGNAEEDSLTVVIAKY